MATKSKSGDKDDAPLIDLNEASIKKLITKAKKKGYVTYDELNDALPQGEMSSDQIEDIQSALSEMGVQIVENDEDAEQEDEVEEIAPAPSSAKEKETKKAAPKKLAAGERTDDPTQESEENQQQETQRGWLTMVGTRCGTRCGTKMRTLAPDRAGFRARASRGPTGFSYSW